MFYILKAKLLYTQAFKNHELTDPLMEPGTADLTADVDFSYLTKIAEKYGTIMLFYVLINCLLCIFKYCVCL